MGFYVSKCICQDDGLADKDPSSSGQKEENRIIKSSKLIFSPGKHSAQPKVRVEICKYYLVVLSFL